jgi:flavodoxin
MKKMILNAVVLFVMISITGQIGLAQKESDMPARSKNNKFLVVYFSHTGNTRAIANQIHKRVGGDIFEIKTVDPYTNDYDALVQQARKELDSDFRPKLKSQVQNIDSYDVVFVGYPIWWGTYPMPVKTFLTEYKLSKKTIVPFCTHEGSGLGRSVSDLKEMCPNSTILKGIAIRGSTVESAQDKVFKWLSEINMTD